MDIKELKRFDCHTHSMYSNFRLIDSINRPKDLIKTAADLGLKGIALTDHETVAGHVDFLNSEKELKNLNLIPKDFKCACGNEIYLVDDRNNIERYWHYILIAKNTDGHKALRELSSIAWYNGYSSRGMMRVPTEKKELIKIVEKYPNTLIASSACLGSELDNLVLELCKEENKQSPDFDLIFQWKSKIDAWIKWNKNLFGDDFYLELQAGVSKDQITFNKRIYSIAKAYGIKLILTSDAHYLTKKERPVHKAYLNSKDGEREVDEFYESAHLMSNEESFENLEKAGYLEIQFEEICKNTMEIYDKIEEYNIFHKPIIPEVEVTNYPPKYDFDPDFIINYPILTDLFSSENEQERAWINMCWNSLKEKGLSDNVVYIKRLEEEADVISFLSNKIEDCLYKYFNTFQHYIELFWKCDSMVGPGRGSSGAFLSNYLLGITQADPIKFGFPLWRFLNKEKIELPDIDIDLTPSRRQAIFEAIRKERGELNLIQVCTYGTEGTRSAIAASGRGYRSKDYPDGLSVEETQYLSSLIPMERGVLRTIHDCVYGNEEKGWQPITQLVIELDKYPGLLEIIESIEGIVCRRGIHASGVMMYNHSPFETNAIMRSPNGELTTQYALHESQQLGDTKFDFLVTEICDKITTCLHLLQKDGVINENMTLKEMYNNYLHPDKIDMTDDTLWEGLNSGTVMDVFQFNTGIGLAAVKQAKPHSLTEMISTNALIRLMPEQGNERPLDRYSRLKQNMNLWYEEVRNAGLTEEEIKVLEPHYLPRYGVPCSQEDLMRVCIDPNIANFSLGEANQARKVVAKKILKKVPELKEKFINSCKSKLLGQYVWKTTMEPQMSYAFSDIHASVYSMVGIQTLYLATHFPPIYWNCACLIINAGGADLLNSDDVLDENEEDEVVTKKKKNKTVNYGKISAAISETKEKGIVVLPPNINKSDLIFKPDAKNNAIIYGMKGITRIGTSLVYEIFKNRPYISLNDFLNKVKVNKLQMINLIKAGTFDEICDCSREEIMKQYLLSVADQKKRITLQNMQMLIAKELVPKELDFQRKLFNFNKYIKKFKVNDYYKLDSYSMKFFTTNYDEDVLENVEIDGQESVGYINQKTWDNTYKKEMNPVRDWMKKNQQEILNELNNLLFKETWEKYAYGNISSWEMDSLGFYYHEHELAHLKNEVYGICDYKKLSEEPKVANIIRTKNGDEIKLFDIARIAGTVIDKDKNRGTVTLLTTTGVVIVKVWKNQFAAWDKQISERDSEGVKHVVEKSWFQRGTKLMICGIRRGDDFVPKKYKNSPYDLFEKIISMDKKGFITSSAVERMEVKE